MQPIEKTIGVAVVGAALSTLSAFAYDLPPDLPARKPGLWEMRMTGIAEPNRVKAITKYCLDASTDRILHELTIMRKELEVVFRDIGCQSPNITLAGDVMTGKMACRSNSPDDDEMAGADFRWTLTFKSDGEVVNEEHSIASDVMFSGENQTVEEQRWIGECTADLKPGDGLDLGYSYNSDEWPSEAKPINIHESLKAVENLLKDGTEINKRLGPM